ncbi:MAG: calcium-binding protein [Sedimentitalea sp.]
MTLNLDGDPFTIPSFGRNHTYVVDNKIVQVGFRAEFSGFNYGERMFFTVLSKNGTVLTPATGLGDELDFTKYPAGFGQNVWHVTSDGSGGLVFHMSEFVRDPAAGYQEYRTTVPFSGGSVGTATEVAPGYMEFERSDTADLSNGNIALFFLDTTSRTAKLQILNPDGTIRTTIDVDGTFDRSGVFAQGTDGLEVLQVGNRIMTLHRDPSDDTLYGQIFALNGTQVTPEFQISTGDHGDSSFAAVWEDGVVDADVLADGRVAVVWSDSKTGSDSTDVWLTILNPDGSVSVPEKLANAGATEGEQYHPRVHALDDGGFVVTFDKNLVPAFEDRGFLQEFDASGTAVGPLLSLGAGMAGTGGTGYGHIFGDGSGFMIDWFGNVQAIESGGGTGGPIPLNGTAMGETLNGTSADEIIFGRGGDDIMRGRGGEDRLVGGNGDDRMFGGGGDDRMQGGNGDDRMLGGTGEDIMFGQSGADDMFGQGGDDDMNGGNGADTLRGAGGRDTLDGGRGMDVLIGGANADRFEFRALGGKDRIADFTDNVDTLVLDDALWTGTLTKQQVLNTYATVVGNDIVFDFGAHELTLDDITNIQSLKNDLIII